MTGSARDAAYEALERCRKDQAWSGASLDGCIRKYALEPRDASLATRLCLGVLQNERYLDYYIDRFCTHPPEPKLRQVLRIGAYQLLFLDKIPAYSAVSETVALCSRVGLARARGMANAVLRRLSDCAHELPPLPSGDPAETLSLRYSHPRWLVERLLSEHDAAFTEAFLRANNEPAPLCLQVNTLKVSEREYCRSLDRLSIPYRASALPGCLLLDGGTVGSLPGYEDGLFYVQDLAARASVAAADPKPGDRVLDACAAPGGKSFSAAVAMQGEGSILSCDIHANKLQRLQSGAERLGISCIQTMLRDGREPSEAFSGAFDLVLADVPCSGLGVIRKRPEIRKKNSEGVDALPSIQAALLDNLALFVRPGGTLLYSTCTVLNAENADLVRAFLARHPEYEPEDFEVGGFRSRNGCYAFWPQIDGTDGFFAAKLRRIQ